MEHDDKANLQYSAAPILETDHVCVASAFILLHS
jgi:hypothetical protein